MYARRHFLKTFDQPLSMEEESKYVEIMRSEDKEAAFEARQILIERNLRLVAHVAKKYASSGEDMEDLISIGTIGLIKSINTFKMDKGNRLAAYAAKCIDNELLMMLRAKKKKQREVSLYEPIGTDKEGNEIRLLDVCEMEHFDVVDSIDINDKMSCILNVLDEVLTGREREIIRFRYGIPYGDEMTQKEIGKKLNISRSYVSIIEKKALTKLKKVLEEKKFTP